MPELDGDEFKQFLYDLTPETFEDFVARVWSERGWNANVTQLSGDSGIDIVATKDTPFQQKQLIQAKRYGADTTVSSPEIQQYASLHQQENNVDAVVVVTSSSFSKQAEQLAEKLNVKLVGGNELYELLRSENMFDILGDYSQNTYNDDTDDIQESATQPERVENQKEHSTTPTRPFGSSVTVKWKTELDEKSPRIAHDDNSLYIGGSNNHLFAVECGAGVILWSIELPHRINCIAVRGECVYVGCHDYHVYCIDRNTGEGYWSFRGDGYINAIDVSDNIVCCRAETHDYSELYAIDAESGEEVWCFEDGEGTHFGDVTIDGGSVYYSSLHKLFSIGLSSGEVQWEVTGKDRSTAPMVHGGSVYVCNDDGHLDTIDTERGDERWSYEAPEGVSSSPRVFDGTVYLGCGDSRLHAIDGHDGSRRWTFSVKGKVALPPVVTDNSLNCASGAKHVYAVDPAEGDLLGEHEFEGSIYAMTADNSTVYITGKKGNVSAIEFSN